MSTTNNSADTGSKAMTDASNPFVILFRQSNRSHCLLKRLAIRLTQRFSRICLVAGVIGCLLIASCLSTATNRTETDHVVVSHQGVGDISRSTPYDANKIQALLPRFSVTETSESVETESGVFEIERISVFDGDTEIMTIDGNFDGKGTVDSISSMSPKVITSEGYTVGTALKDMFSTDVAESCYVPINYEGPARQYLVCRHPSSRRIQYLFGGNWAEDFTEMPSPEALEDATLQVINWWSGDS